MMTLGTPMCSKFHSFTVHSRAPSASTPRFLLRPSTAKVLLRSSPLLPSRTGPCRATCAAASGKDDTQAVSQEDQVVTRSEFPTSMPEVAGSKSTNGIAKLLKTVLQGAAVLTLAFALALGSVSPALAARSGGRVGGSSFSSARSSSSYGGGKSYSSGSSGGSSFSSRGYGSSLGMTVAPSLFYPTYGYGYGAGPAVVSDGGGSGIFNILLLAFGAYVLFQVASGFLNDGQGMDLGAGRTSVAKLQVGLLSNARGLKADLDRIAKRADTNTPEGLHYVLQETVLALLRNPEYSVYGAAAVSSQRDMDAGEEKFNELCMKERGKFKEETLVNVSGRTKRGNYSKGYKDESGELIVVTIIVAADTGVKLPNISNKEELTTALNKLGSLRADQVLAVEILWTPQEDGDYFTKDDLMVDYPKLNTL